MTAEVVRIPVELPSRGAYYGGKIPATLHVRPMIIKDEQYLHTVSEDLYVDTVITRCVQEDVDFNEFLAGDKMTVLFKIREISFGPEYEFKVSCPHCRKASVQEVSIASFPLMWYVESDGKEPFEVVLPMSGHKCLLKFPRAKDDKKINDFRKQFYRKNPKTAPDPTRGMHLKAMVQSVDGMDKAEMEAYLTESIVAADYRFIEDFLYEKMPRPLILREFECNNPDCGQEFEVNMPITPSFFRYGGRKDGVHPAQ